MTALVTGGAGFIGHHLAAALARDDAEVVVLDNLLTGSADRLAPLGARVRLVEGDVRDPADLERLMPGVDVVFHLAALPSVARSVEDPVTSDAINVGGTIQVMTAAARHGVRRVVVAGSSSVYGDSPALPRREDQAPSPRSPYAVGKLAAEQYAHVLGRLGGIEVVALRYFNVFGPGQDPASPYAALVPRVVQAALDGRPPVVHGDGRQTRDFTYVGDAVHATLLAATAVAAAGRTLNVAAGGRHTVLDVVDLVGEAVGRPLEPVFEPARPGDVRDSEADISLARSTLGYEPTVDLRRGIELTVDAFEVARGG